MERIGGDDVKHLEDCTVANAALGTWFFSVAGTLLAIPVGIKRKSLAPLVFFGTTGTMLDIIMGISQCEREHAERQMKLQEEQKLAAGLATTTADETDG
ncbi:transmembrane protein [Rhynchospora pubera]|uniref:Transmembrane protein n=1 Tax=Rhynchospora pubera TaxID=906938 RepID=A0AAV8CMD5_9POAL|nr:transmembrane protein [Rhynchospora pubera]